jgi:hypothetical protein
MDLDSSYSEVASRPARRRDRSELSKDSTSEKEFPALRRRSGSSDSHSHFSSIGGGDRRTYGGEPDYGHSRQQQRQQFPPMRRPNQHWRMDENRQQRLQQQQRDFQPRSHEIWRGNLDDLLIEKNRPEGHPSDRVLERLRL